ncbi:MAG: hypothetical protein DF168_00317 [Candidatus Moanabacter tarae]|uniref:Uncharacterized protein n=1 Tax=Candidatus Moanibacter tarae TaxID=2200854 RepID=A0A2Z4AB60_9BACT|nr:MAG: hypothetical protein DF168_00317 [Candidatus Moanabacter tarae]|tara:strand:+ start:607 stop:801 length:195 start_codon:yes stop_codon:yes gene_type:complete
MNVRIPGERKLSGGFRKGIDETVFFKFEMVLNLKGSLLNPREKFRVVKNVPPIWVVSNLLNFQR